MTAIPTPSPAAPDRWILVSCLAGVAGATVLLAGDFLFYGGWGSAGDFDPLAIMARRAPATLILGALTGHVGGLLYAAAAMYFFANTQVAARHARRGVAAAMALPGIAIGFYHLAFPFLGFAARLSLVSERSAQLVIVRTLLAHLNLAMYACGAIGTALVLFLRATGRSRIPIWLLPLLPTLTSLVPTLAPGLLHTLPAPWGALVRGGWDNGCFALFFAAALVHAVATRPGNAATAPVRA